MQTMQQFDTLIQECKTLFLAKHSDYGSSWRILRPSSLTDQLYIKASRIRQIEESGTQKVSDDIREDYQGLINYSVMALIQLRHGAAHEDIDADTQWLSTAYDQEIQITRTLLQNKNHDYGEVWRKMRMSSYTDLILMKLLRIKRIEDNLGHTEVSEGMDANYQDIINYSIFALIKKMETAESSTSYV